jgi:hypothetical protein
MAQSKKTLYEILGVERDANELDIGLAHQRRVKEMQRTVPPDPSKEALVQQAFEVLSNEKRRAAYDAQLLTAAERSAAAEQSTTDLEIGEDEEPKRKLPIVPIAAAAVAAAIALFFVFKPAEAPKPEKIVVASKPAPPPPPKARSALEVLGSTATSIGRVLVYSMSGSATPIGLAVSTEPATMITTCHAIPVGGKLVVNVGKDQFPADLTITDEALDLCRLSVQGFSTPPLKLATEEPKAGDKFYMVSQDGKGELTAAEGTIKGMRGAFVELSTPVPATGTGAGVFDQYGALVGIATAQHNQPASLHLAIPATALSQMRSRTK